MPKPINARRLIAEAGGKALHIPDNGWNAYSFSRHGEAMVATLARVARITQRRAWPTIATGVHAFFLRQLREIISIVTRRRAAAIAGRKDITLAFDQHESLWNEAMREVFAEAGLEIVTRVGPTIQSVMAQGYAKTTILLGETEIPHVNAIIAREARGLANEVVSINETTREQLSRHIQSAIHEGLSVADTAAKLEAEMPSIMSNRALTIARTETSNAWNQGAARSYKQSETLTHVSVIGCEAREKTSPQYRGQSTCNFPDLAVVELDAFLEVGFHPNHTGNIVPSRFRNEDGTTQAAPEE